jgi:hypothetical protein
VFSEIYGTAEAMPLQNADLISFCLAGGFAYLYEVGIEQKEQPKGDGHEVHVETEKDATMVEAPAPLHTSDCVGCADRAAEDGQHQERHGVNVREPGHEHRDSERDENDGVASGEGAKARVEDGEGQGFATGVFAAEC